MGLICFVFGGIGNRKERRSITTDVEAVIEWLTGLHGLKFETPLF